MAKKKAKAPAEAAVYVSPVDTAEAACKKEIGDFLDDLEPKQQEDLLGRLALWCEGKIEALDESGELEGDD